jgi:hypothetical protein
MFDVRSDIAAAINFAWVEVAPEYRQNLAPYSGFVKWGGRIRDDSGLGWIDTWQIWIALPQDVKTAEEWLSGRLDELLQAVHTELVITSALPAELVLPGGSTNGLIIEGTRASA